VSSTGDFFEQFQRSAWRLETRPFYGPDADEFQRFWDKDAQALAEGVRRVGRVE